MDVRFRCDPPRWRLYLDLSLKIFEIGGMSKKALPGFVRSVLHTVITQHKLEQEMAIHATISSPFI